MYTKVLAISALIGVTQGGLLGANYGSAYSTSYSTAHVNAPVLPHGYAAPVIAHAYAPAVSHNIDYYAYPKYEFSYGVKDPHTGDDKSQHEERDGDVVKGYYTLTEPDGTQRTVHYTADEHNGFNAVVEKSGPALHPEVYHKQIVSAEPIYYHH